MREEQLDQSADLWSVLRVLRRRLGVILLITVLVPATALVLSILAEKQYTAKATLLFRDPQLDQKLFGSSFVQQSRDDARAAATNLALVSLRAVAARTAAALDQEFTANGVLNQEFTATSVLDAVEVSAEGQADVISIHATDPSPRRAAKVANTFAEEYVAFRRAADRLKVTEAKQLVKRQLDRLPPGPESQANARSLGQRLQELEILTSLQTGNAELVQRAVVPETASSPQPVRNVALGTVLGLLLGLGFAFLVERLDRRIRDPEELRDIFGRPILTTVQASKELGDPDQPDQPLQPAAAEAFRMLRANLRYFNVDEGVRSVLVTSPQPGDGKSTVAWNLSSAAAAAGVRTLLIEADLRRPSLGRRVTETRKLGLSELLSRQCELDEAISQVDFGEGNGSAPTHSVDIILAGPLPPNPDELIESERMRDILRSAEARYELVVIDTPPTSVVSDAIPLVNEVTGVLVVGRVDQTTRDSARNLARQLENLDARVLGVVVNHLRARGARYGYAYGYGGYADSRSSQASEGTPSPVPAEHTSGKRPSRPTRLR